MAGLVSAMTSRRRDEGTDFGAQAPEKTESRTELHAINADARSSDDQEIFDAPRGLRRQTGFQPIEKIESAATKVRKASSRRG
jgi:hypothetical protein